MYTKKNIRDYNVIVFRDINPSRRQAVQKGNAVNIFIFRSKLKQ